MFIVCEREREIELSPAVHSLYKLRLQRIFADETDVGNDMGTCRTWHLTLYYVEVVHTVEKIGGESVAV